MSGASVYNYYRDYSPEIGRYIESDPVGLTGGINTYTYVGGKPISRVDPRGLDNPGMGPYDPPKPTFQSCMAQELPKCTAPVVASCAAICGVTAPTGPGAVGCAVGCACTIGYTCYELTEMHCRYISGQ